MNKYIMVDVEDEWFDAVSSAPKLEDLQRILKDVTPHLYADREPPNDGELMGRIYTVTHKILWSSDKGEFIIEEIK